MPATPWGDLPAADAHVHFFSHRFYGALAAQKNLPDAESLGPLLQWEIPPPGADALATRWATELDRHGIARAALIASIPGDEASVEAAVAAFPKRFYGYFMLDPLRPDALNRVTSAFSRGHVHAICLFPAMHCYSVADARLQPIFEAAAERGAVVFVHCGAFSLGVRKRLGLPSPFDMRYSNPIELHPVAMRYPSIRFVVPHFGAGYFREALMLADLAPNVWLDTSSSNRWIGYEPGHLDLRMVFRRALDLLGPERLLFGTDSSFFPRGWHAAIFERQTTALYELGLKEHDARLILHDNLAGLFGESRAPSALSSSV